MNQITYFFIKNAKFTIVITGFIVILGVFGLATIKSESYPAVNFAAANITTYYPGATADDVEAKITIPIEEEIRKVSGLKDVRSTSQAGLSKISVRVDMDNEDEVEVLADLEKAIDRVTNLPNDLRDPPDFQELKSEEFPAIELALYGPNDKLQRDRIANRLKDELEDSNSVKEVRLVNYTDPEILISVDQKKMDRAHLSITEVLSQVSLRNSSAPGGDIKGATTQRIIKVDGKTPQINQLENIVLRSNFNGQQVQLKEIATAKNFYEKRTVLARYNNQNATLMIVTKKAGKDTIKMVDDLQRRLKQYENMPEHKIVIYNNEAKKVKNKISVLGSNALTGLVLVVVFLFIFLPGWIGVMASLSLPIAIMGTIGLMPTLGMNLDTITTLALIIALGMMVDNAVVISENFTRLRKEGVDAQEAALDSIRTLWFPITATALTTVAAFLPMLVTKGIMGEFIKWIPIIVTITLVMSLLESFYLLPMRLKFVGFAVKNSPDGTSKSDWFERFQDMFESFMKFCLKIRYLILVIFIGLIATSFVFMFKMNKFILFPAEQTEIYITRYEVDRSSNVENTLRVGGELSDKIKEVLGKDVAHLTLRSGDASSAPNDPKSKTKPSAGLILIYMTKQASFDLFYLDVLKKLRAITHPEIKSLNFQELVNGPPVGDAVNATFRSSNSQQLEDLLQTLKLKLAQTPGIIDIKDDTVLGPREVKLNFNHSKIAKLGLDIRSISQTVKVAFQGDIASTVVLNDEEVPIRVRLDNSSKSRLSNLENLNIIDRRGNLIPVSALVSLEETQGSPDRKRFDFKRSRTLTANVDSRITSPKANMVLRDHFQMLKSKYPDVSITFGGEAESTAESLASLAQAGVLAIICIYAILVLVFDSFIRPILIISTIPLGLVGFSIAFYFHDRPISFLALIGIIGLAGIIVNSGIVLISFIDQLKNESDLSLTQILSKASGMRLRAVLVTSLTTISGLFPTAYGVGGSEPMLIAMTLAMAWGLTSGTILTLVWIPCGYAIIDDIMNVFKSIFKKVTS